jgi:hypothetical protein
MQSVEHMQTLRWIGWLPLSILRLGLVVVGSRLLAWAFMWILSFAIYAGLKWASWWTARAQAPHAGWRSAAYLLAWPGMDAESFLNAGPCIPLSVVRTSRTSVGTPLTLIKWAI